ncbi:MAG: hypothetical protein J6Y08_02295 [Clostridiales bacterium]|nr:hypothetical protein [Clostridiales bacterium]
MKSIYAKAWGCFGIMMLGAVSFMTSLAFLNNEVLLYLFLILGSVTFLAGIILHYVFVKCPHCDTHIGRVYGSHCPHCGKPFNK